MKIHRDQLTQARRLVTSLGEEIQLGNEVHVTWGPDHTYYVVEDPHCRRYLNPDHVVSVHFDPGH